ncbi:glycosyltransferase [Pseudohoeflea suaedae]|uniref:Glycosyltransferase n=1 Tax=Pseudohoeflea suaedae TaxID=877384 RepID=A0A4R5PNX0_9HYPH|nr:glycosyltransferase [Pseudohoeflea suaedae]TDH38331.1 glycosyltransferase [Pseudohoeflea suaedae]
MTILSICIPTRNRQAYAIDAARHMLKSERDDFEIVIGDNSDDPRPISAFVAEAADSRLKMIPPADRPLTMLENWERIVPETSGEWITYIGDDDYVDPELCEIIRVATARVETVDSISWGRAYYTWPDARAEREITTLPTSSHLHGLEKKDLMKRMFFWDQATDRPGCPFGIYHGTIRRSLLEQIRETFSGRYFEHGNLDYDNICKVVMLARNFVLWERPLSVFGTCRASNTMALRDRSLAAERSAQFLAENAEGFYADGFPFPADLGITASIGHTIERFKQKYGIELSGWEDNFIAACAKDCETTVDRDQFDARKSAYGEAIAEWRGKDALKSFRPEFKWRPEVPRYVGLHEDKLYIDMGMGDTGSAGEYYEMIDGMLFPVHLLEGRLK